MVPFNAQFKDDAQDKDLGSTLKQEAEGILAWMVQGCLLWQKEGLKPPSAIVAATQEYRSDQDRLGNFINDCCDTHPELRVKISELYAAYGNWAKVNGAAEINGTAFGLAMRERGYKKDVGKRWYLGISLRPAEE
jgi:putative DNA primase/helicase